MKDKTCRCSWCNMKNQLYIEYHDNEWGVPTYDDRLLYEMLVLEPFQAGLSWETVLNKREAFRKAFDGFVPEKICTYDEIKIEELLANKDIIRNRKKIEATINNARIFLEIQKEWGDFSTYIWHFSEGKVIRETGKSKSELSDTIAKDLKKYGMKFLGTTTVYAYLQAIGVVCGHDEKCFLV
ncbi:MAG: DNA-3-methyladenine glycosylase I [Lachnospiraceae bacterium]|nr:DNA-3-methyladenine glycosylase I [Lachnospiraceae bacterium]